MNLAIGGQIRTEILIIVREDIHISLRISPVWANFRLTTRIGAER